MLEDNITENITEAQCVFVKDVRDESIEDRVIISNPESIWAANMQAFFLRLALGCIASYMYHKGGARIDDYSRCVMLGFTAETVMDFVGMAAESAPLGYGTRFSDQRIKGCLRDDPGAIAGWTLGLMLGMYINRNFL
jgi:hypothetical protein